MRGFVSSLHPQVGHSKGYKKCEPFTPCDSLLLSHTQEPLQVEQLEEDSCPSSIFGPVKYICLFTLRVSVCESVCVSRASTFQSCHLLSMVCMMHRRLILALLLILECACSIAIAGPGIFVKRVSGK